MLPDFVEVLLLMQKKKFIADGAKKSYIADGEIEKLKSGKSAKGRKRQKSVYNTYVHAVDVRARAYDAFVRFFGHVRI